MTGAGSPLLVRPIVLTLALLLAAADLAMALAAPEPRDAAALFLLSSTVVTCGILFWMLVLVRGDHGWLNRFIGVRKDDDLQLPNYAKILFVFGAATCATGIAMQRSSPAGIWLFATGPALMAAASTQFRHDLPD